METLTAALDDSLAGRGRVVMLAGEPGIGKTRIAEELAGLAEQRGARVLWGWCYEQEGAPPYWPWVQPVRSYINATDPELLRVQMGPGAADIAEVIPEVRNQLPDLEPPPALDPNQARFRLFDSIAALFKSASQAQPLMLVLEDLHWADQASLLLLEFLARQISEISLLVVGTYRDAEVSSEHPLFGTLAHLSRNPSFHRQILDGLAPSDVEEFILAANASDPSQELVDAVYAHTEGNPFFMTEVIRLLGEHGDSADSLVDSRTMLLAIPQSVLEVIGERLNRLSKECNSLLTTAAVIGRQFDFNLLGALNEEIAEFELIGMVEDALAAQLIQEIPDAKDRYQFCHALVQQTLLERLSTSRKVRLHARVGEVLETLYENHFEEHAAELAYHFAEAEPSVGIDKLVKYTMLAGEGALAAYAHEEALVHFSRGLIAKGVDVEGVTPLPDADAAALLFGLARAQAATLRRHNLDVAFASLSRAFDFYAETDEVTQAITVAEFPMQTLPGHQLAAKLVGRALRLIPPDSPEAGRLWANYILVMGLEEGDYQAAVDAFESALGIAQRTGDVVLEARALANSSIVDYWHMRWQGAIEKGLRVSEMPRLAADQFVGSEFQSLVAAAFWHLGDSKAAQPHAETLLASAEGLRDRYRLATALWFNSLLSACQGEWQAAKEFNERGLLVSPSDTRLLGTRMVMEFDLGDAIQGQAYLEEFLEVIGKLSPEPRLDHAFAALLIPITTRITGAVDQLHMAESAATTALAVSTNPLVTKFARLGLGLIAVLRGDVEAAKEQYVTLGSASGTYLNISGDRILGLMAQTMGKLDQAMAHFEDALAFCRKAGNRPDLAWTCHDYAAMLIERNKAEDLARAKDLLDESLSISSNLAMRPLLERLAALQESAESGSARGPAFPDGLTQREVEVLRLVASGRTDREIAEDLIISVRTVTTHVGNILNKTGSANRAEAASYANQHGLVATVSEGEG